MSLELLLLFATATVTFAFMPGPAILYVVAATLTGGRSAGLRAAIGVHIGGYLHVIAAVAGLAVLLQTIPVAYTALKLLGAAYLIWIGLRLMLSRRSAEEPAADTCLAATAQRQDSSLVEPPAPLPP